MNLLPVKNFVIVCLFFIPVSALALGTVLSDEEILQDGEVTCGLINSQWLPGVLKGTKFISHLEKKKKFAKKAKTDAKFKKKKAKFGKLHNQQLETCTSAGENAAPSATRGMQYFTSNCALSGCHADTSTDELASYSLEKITGAYDGGVEEMSLLTQPSDSSLADLVAYFSSL
ncbi:MAG: hypothetical protein KDD64_11425 [Bdellovibrionales bacterium]|nr:hypothetical protein [Bdellovibrionales bacterium]